MIDWEKATAELSKKLDPANVKPAKQFGPKGDYIEGWLAIQEANRIFGFGAWSYVVPEVACVYQGAREIGKDKKPGFGVTYTAKVAVNASGVVREDFGAGHGYDVDCGLAHESAIKEAVTDALKRALRSFGNPFGLALYDKSRENVGVDEPPYDAEGAAQSIREAIAARKTKQQLSALWKQCEGTLRTLRDNFPSFYEPLKAEFAAAGAKAIDDPAMQASDPQERNAA